MNKNNNKKNTQGYHDVTSITARGISDILFSVIIIIWGRGLYIYIYIACNVKKKPLV